MSYMPEMTNRFPENATEGDGRSHGDKSRSRGCEDREKREAQSPHTRGTRGKILNLILLNTSYIYLHVFNIVDFWLRQEFKESQSVFDCSVQTTSF